MTCNGENCLSIANDYSVKKGSVNSSLNNMKSDITSASDTLNTLNVPEDYIGNKVKTKLETVFNDLSASADRVSAYNNEVSSFVDQKVAEHQTHYRAWKQRQEELALKAKEELEKIDVM